MASVQIYRIQFLKDNPFGGFVTGDILDVYIDPDLATVPAAPLTFQTAGMHVNLNGVLYTGSDALLDFSSSLISVQNFNAQICVGTSLLVFNMYFVRPFIYYYSEANHYSCTVNPPTCNLIINGVPIVVPATDQTASDGSIQIVASSSNDIEYNLGSDFVYGEGQIESIFTNLLPGSYRIFLRDSANCAVNILVNVPFNNEFGTKYRLEYTDENNLPTRLDITMRGYTGEIFEVCGSGIPFELSLRGEGSTNKFEALMSSQGNLNLVSHTDMQFIELYTNDPNLYRLEYSKDFGNIIPGDVGYTPAVLPDLDDWSNVDIGGDVDWTGTPPVVDFNGLGLSKQSNLWYTDYAFEEGRTYTFDYELYALNPYATYKIKVFDASMNELLNTDIIMSQVNQTGQYVVNAPAGAAGIGISVYFAPSCGAATPGFCEKSLVSFTNATASIPGTPDTPRGYELLWYGKVLPMQYAEEYKAPPYYVSVVATDGLAELKNNFLIQNDGQKYYGTISLIKLVAYCLSPIKLNLDIRVACNLYALDMNKGEANDPFDQAYVDFAAFYIAEREPTLEFVLKSILEAFGARITQWENRWNIERVEEKIAEYDYRDFDFEGNYLSYGSYNPVTDLEYDNDANGDEVIYADADHNLEIRPGYGKLKAIYHLGLKQNILENGDFRLKSTYYAPQNTYYFSLNKEGWTLVNGGYTLEEGFEYLDENNIAYKITAGEDMPYNLGGNAYIQSDSYTVRMGTNNQLKILVRCKVMRLSSYFGTLVFTIDVPYVKIRFRVKYGSLYLQSDGSWTTDENILTFYCTEFNAYKDYEVVANQPVTGTPVSGMALDIRVYHAFAYHAQFTSLTDLRAFPTWTGTEHAIPTGYRTEVRTSTNMLYFELEESTDADDGVAIIEPDDANVSNERRWIRKNIKPAGPTVIGIAKFPMAIDKVVIKYLTDGNDPIDTIVRTAIGEAGNHEVLERSLVIGSYSDLIVTEASFSLELGVFFPSGGLALTTTNALAADLIYTGWLRDQMGNGYDQFARDGVAESDKLHGILLKSYAAQYKRSWRLFRGSVKMHKFFGLLQVIRNVNEGNRIYLPIGITIQDKRAIVSGEFLEIGAAAGGSDGSGSSPFSSGFTTGFGASGFN